MSQAVRDRLKKSFAAMGFAQAVNLTVQIGTIPLFIHFWGSFLYGEWVILSTVPSYFALSDLGFANAAGTEMTMRVARGDRAGALKVFQSAWVLVTGVSLLVTLTMIGAAHWLPLERWLHVSDLGHAQVVTVVSILIFQIFFDLQTGLISAGYRCDGKFALATMIFNIQRFIEFIVAAVALFCGAHLIELALVVMVMRLIGNTLSLLYMRRLSPWLTFGWQHADAATLKQITSPALSFMGFPIGYALSLQGMVMVVGIVLGPGAVTIFSTSRTLTRFVSQVMNAITNSVWVEMSTAFGANDIPLARSLHHRACQAALWLTVTSSTVLFFAGPLIFRLWTRGKVPFDPTLFGLLLLVVVANSFWSVSYAALLSVNRHQRLAAVFVASTGLSLGLAFLLTRVMGLHGTALSLLVIDLFMSTYVVRRSLTLVQDTMPAFIRFILTPPFSKPPPGAMAEVGRIKEPTPSRPLGRVDASLSAGSLNTAHYRHYGVPEGKIASVPYAVDNDFFQKQASLARMDREELGRTLGLMPGRPVILFASKFQQRKSATDLLEAYLALSPDGRQEPAPYLLFVGDGEERPPVEQRAQETGWESIRFLGFKNQTDLPPLFDLCDVFVLPSAAEPWGLIVNDVRNAANPVVVTNEVGASPDLVREGGNGYIVPVGDVEALAGRLRDFLGNPDTARRIISGSGSCFSDSRPSLNS